MYNSHIEQLPTAHLNNLVVCMPATAGGLAPHLPSTPLTTELRSRATAAAVQQTMHILLGMRAAHGVSVSSQLFSSQLFREWL